MLNALNAIGAYLILSNPSHPVSKGTMVEGITAAALIQSPVGLVAPLLLEKPGKRIAGTPLFSRSRVQRSFFGRTRTASGASQRSSTSGETVVPDVEGLPQIGATQTLSDSGLMVAPTITQVPSDVAQGSVVQQRPAPGAVVPIGTEIGLFISSGRYVAPTPAIDLQKVDDDIGTLKSDVDIALAGIGSQITGLQIADAGLAQAMQSVNTALASIGSQITGLQIADAGLTETVQSVNTELSSIGFQIAGIQAQNATLQSDIEDNVQKHLESVRASVDRRLEHITKLLENMPAAKTKGS
jgi:PASTA domain